MEGFALNDNFLMDAFGDNPSALAIRAESVIVDEAEDRAVVLGRNPEVE